ncbi:hypothetical protein SprV_0502002800 [Sparganum proliferum]
MEPVAHELANYKVYITAHRETRLSEQDPLEKVGTSCTFFWSSRSKAEQQEADVAFVIRKDIVGRLPSPPQGINNRLMSLPLRASQSANTKD